MEDQVLPTLRELGIGLTAYGVLSRGLLGANPVPTGPGDFRAYLPRFQAENLRHNLALVEELGRLAAEKEATVAQVAFAWVLSRGSDIVPLVGTKRRERLTESLGALQLTLSPTDLTRIEAAIPPGAAAGDRYPAEQMAHLDSERR